MDLENAVQCLDQVRGSDPSVILCEGRAQVRAASRGAVFEKSIESAQVICCLEHTRTVGPVWGRWPAPSPDGRSLAFVRDSGSGPIHCADEIVVRHLETGAERVFSPPPGTGPEFAVEHLAWAPDSRRLAYAVSEQQSVAVLDTAAARSQSDAVDVNPDREAFPGCLMSPTWGPDDTLLMLGVEPYDQCGAGQDQGSPNASVVALDLDTAAVERRRPVPLAGVLRADASGQHLLLSPYGDLAILELRRDGGTREISRQAAGADW